MAVAGALFGSIIYMKARETYGVFVMAEKSKPVEIISIDTETLDKDYAFPEAYAFYVRLSVEPDTVWKSYLGKWEKALFNKSREIRVAGDKLRLVCTYDDNIENYIEHAKYLVKWVNERVEEYNKRVELQQKTEMTEQETERKKEYGILKKLKELEPEPIPAAIDVTAEELITTFEADEKTANERFAKKTLKVTGLVDRIEARNTLDINYIILGDAEKNLLPKIRCMFDKGHSDKLKELRKGEIAIVQGKFDGSMVQLRMRGC
ncbi:MAG: OB-fold protein, partial [Candidatus Thorarchaeota archaeon]